MEGSVRMRLLEGPSRVRGAALVVLAGAALTIGGAYVFQYGLGYQPCKLCLQQRLPYYAAMPIAILVAALPRRGPGERIGRLGLALLAAVLIAGAGLGIYHAGVEWGFWLGPSDCGGPAGAAPGNVGDFLQQLDRTRVVSCTEAAWRFLGLSLAGWNVVIATALALVAAFAAAWPRSASRA